MSILDSIKTTLKQDLKVVESDAQEIASKMLASGEQTFSSIVDSVVQKVKGKPLAELLESAFKIYRQLHGGEKAAAPAPGAAQGA
jgi:hypothetical protein